MLMLPGNVELSLLRERGGDPSACLPGPQVPAGALPKPPFTCLEYYCSGRGSDSPSLPELCRVLPAAFCCVSIRDQGLTGRLAEFSVIPGFVCLLPLMGCRSIAVVQAAPLLRNDCMVMN